MRESLRRILRDEEGFKAVYVWLAAWLVLTIWVGALVLGLSSADYLAQTAHHRTHQTWVRFVGIRGLVFGTLSMLVSPLLALIPTGIYRDWNP